MNLTINLPVHGAAERAAAVARRGSDADAQTGDFGALFDELAPSSAEQAGVEQEPQPDTAAAADMPEDGEAAGDLSFAYSRHDGDQAQPAVTLTTSPEGSADDLPEADTPEDAEVAPPRVRAANRGHRQKDAVKDSLEGRDPAEPKITADVAMTTAPDAVFAAPSLTPVPRPLDTQDAPVTGADAGSDPENGREASPTRRGDDSRLADTKAAGESMAPGAAQRDERAASRQEAAGTAGPDEADTPSAFVTTSTKAEGDRSTRPDAEAAPLVTVSTLPPAKAKGARPSLPERAVTAGPAETVQARWTEPAEESNATSQTLASGEVGQPKPSTTIAAVAAPVSGAAALPSGPAVVAQGDQTPSDGKCFARAQSGIADLHWGRGDQVAAIESPPATPTMTVSSTVGESAGTIESAPMASMAEGAAQKAPAIEPDGVAEVRLEPKPQMAAAGKGPADRQTIVRQGPDAVSADRIAAADLPSSPDAPEGQEDETADATAPIMARADRQQTLDSGAPPISTTPAEASPGGNPAAIASASPAASTPLSVGVAQGIVDALGAAQPAVVMAPDPAETARAEPVRTIALNLDLREYGQIDVRVSLTGSAIRVHLKAEREETVQALARDDASLREALHRAGYETQQVQIDRRDASAPRPSDAAGSPQQPASGTGASSGQTAGGGPTATPEQRPQGRRDAEGFALQDQETHDAPRQDRYRGSDRLYV